MIVTAGAQSPVSDGQRLGDSSKARDQSPVRRLLSSTGLQQLQQHLTRRSSSPLGRPTVTTTATAAAPVSSPRSPPASPLRRSGPDATAAGPSSWAKRTPSPACETYLAVGVSAAPTVAVTASARAAEQPGAAGAPGDTAAVQQPAAQSPPDAAAGAAPADAHWSQHLAGKRKFLEGANSTELQYDAHVKSPAHTYEPGDAANQQQQQQQQQSDASGLWQRDQQQQQQQQPGLSAVQDESSPFFKQDGAQQLPQQQLPQSQPLHQQDERGQSQQQQQQQQQQALSLPPLQQQHSDPTAASPSPGPARRSSSPVLSSGSGDMRPPSLVDMARRVLGRRPELFGPVDGSPGASGWYKHSLLRRSQSGNAAATAAAGSAGAGGLPPSAPLRTASHDVSMGGGSTSMHTASMQDGGEAIAGVSSLCSEPSLNQGQPLHRALSGAASLEAWLGPVSRTTSGSPRSLGGERQSLPRTNSNMSTGSGQGSVGRQGSLAFAQTGGLSRGSSLDKQPSFAGWPELQPAAATAAAAAAAAAAGSAAFSWPPLPMRTISEDSLKMDIQMMPAVLPEDYPPEPPAGPVAHEQHAGHLPAAAQPHQQQQHQQQQVDRAFFAKVSSWEDELVEMLECQAAPVAIRNIVSVFKDRIHTERDKAEFKALCDKWTGVVEYPAGSGVKCLAIKSWMRGTHTSRHNGHHPDDDDDDDVGDWDD